MPNLVLTYQCNRSCPFCFAEKGNSGISYNPDIISKQYPFIESSGRKSINLIGGEPTQNPDFIPLLNWLISKNLEISVFTNGVVRTETISQLKNMNLENVRFVVNRSAANNKKEVYHFYRSLGHLTGLSVTLFHPKQRLGHIIREIREFRLLNKFRLGIALPVFNNNRNQSWINPGQYDLAATRLISFFKKTLKAGISPEFDCGFPFCFFNDEQKSFLTENKIRFSSDCGIIPDMNAANCLFPCFPLSYFSFSFRNCDIWSEKEHEIKEFLKKLNRNPLYKKCADCEEPDKSNCNGGCLSIRLAERTYQNPQNT